MATASPGNFDEILARGEAKLRECPDTRRRFKATVSRAAERMTEPVPAPPVPARRSTGILAALLATVFGKLFTIALLAAAVLAACSTGCVPIEAIDQARNQAGNAYGLSKRAGTDEGRAISAAFLDAWRRQHVALTGDDVPRALEEGWPELRDPAPVTSAR